MIDVESSLMPEKKPFIPFKTELAQRICQVAGVEKIHQLIGMLITIHSEEGNISVISTITAISHEDGPELLTIKIDEGEFNAYIESYDRDVTCSCAYFNDEEDEDQEIMMNVMLGIDDRLLFTEEGKLADEVS